ncbi:hypothetical protein CRE_24292 [Caenorhabditis remanei]|uniref:Sdz-33 F-box domain-containing protein n=1 Tax=Caenorhabditis remanei TaxID=31234 RepID=E3NLC2_CAERE|nr:hypothetical protein CRE_24292 [Caenorhabditis remanei]
MYCGHARVLQRTRYISKIFQCKFSISKNFNSDIYQPVVSELFDLQQEFKTLTIDLNVLKDRKLWDHISTKFGLVEDLSISSSFDPGFRPVLASWPQKIAIMNSDWFTLESFLACTCTRIKLGWSNFGNNDLDVILRKWKTGGFPNLERLMITSGKMKDNGEHILGMNWSELEGMVILSDDGSKKATIHTYFCSFKMSVTPI